MKRIIVITALFIAGTSGFCQYRPPDSLSQLLIKGINRNGQQLRIGDIVPEIERKMINYSSPRIRLSDLRGKWVILDFWSNGCSSCIEALPRMEKLKAYFGDKLFILPISFESAADAGYTLNNVCKKIGPDAHLFSIVEDTTTYSLFTAYVNPFEVWIDPSGKIAARTGVDYVTKENIQAALDGKPLNFYDYSFRSYGMEEDTTTPIINGVTFRRVFGYHDSKILLHPDTTSARLRETGDIATLYIKAYGITDPTTIKEMDRDYLYKRLITDFDPMARWHASYLPGSYTPENQHNDKYHSYYGYESVMPSVMDKKIMGRKMINDLDQFFNLRSAIEKRVVTVWRLVKLKDFQAALPTKEKDWEVEERTELNSIVRDSYTINNCTLGDLVQTFRDAYDYPFLPIIHDGTGIKGKIHLPLRLDKNITIEGLRTQLRKYQLDLVPEKKEMNMLVLHEKGNKI